MAAAALVLVEWGVELCITAGEEVAIARESATAIDIADATILGGRVVARNLPAAVARQAGSHIAPKIVRQMAQHWTKLIAHSPQSLELMQRLTQLGRFAPARAANGQYIMRFIYRNKAGETAILETPLSGATSDAQIAAWLNACLRAASGRAGWRWFFFR